MRKMKSTYQFVKSGFRSCVFACTLICLILSCTNENAPTCFQAAGDPVRDEVVVPFFDQITVFENIEMILIQGPEQKVEIEAGEYLRNEVDAEVVDGVLRLTDDNNCNLFRDYGTTRIFVTTPDILEIRSSTSWPIRSAGPLSFNNIRLVSESFNNPESETRDGSFDLEFNSTTVNVVVNGIAYFKLSGATENLNINVAAGDSRIEAEELVAQHVNVNHRGTNNVLVNPQQSLQGVIRGTGNVISFNRPPLVDVDVIFKGDLIFRE